MSVGGAAVALGEGLRISALGLAGVRLCAAETPDAVLRAWAGVQASGLVILTAAAAEALDGQRLAAGAPLTVVMPS
jgi:hypothetical protein